MRIRRGIWGFSASIFLVLGCDNAAPDPAPGASKGRKVLKEYKASAETLKLLKLSKSPDQGIRRAAVIELADMRPSTHAVIKALIQATKDSYDRVRYAALNGLSYVGPATPEVDDAVIALMHDEVLDVRLRAISYFQQFTEGSSTAPPEPPPFCLPLQDDPSQEARSAIPLDKAMPALIKVLKDEVPEVRRKAAVTLGNIGAVAKSALPALKEALGDADARVQSAAKTALWKMERKR